LTSRKIQDGGARHVENHTFGHISAIFAPNLIHKLKMGSCSQIYHENSHRPKIQDGGGHHIENYIFGHKLTIIAYICTEFDTKAENGVLQPDLMSKFI